MIDIKTAMEIGQYKVSGGSEYCWKCFGPNARYMDFELGLHEKSFSIVFDTVTQTVYEATVCDYVKQNCYRIINPDYVEQYQYEANSRNVNYKQAYDDIDYIDLCVDKDFIEKATAIINDLPYDERVIITIDLPDDMVYSLMKEAHELDITFNEFIAKILQDEIEKSNEVW